MLHEMSRHATSPRWLLLVPFSTLTIGLLLFFHLTSESSGHVKVSASFSSTGSNQRTNEPDLESAKRLWATLQPLLAVNSPDVPPPPVRTNIESPRYNATDLKTKLMDHTAMHSSDILKMKERHKSFVLEIKKQAYTSANDTPSRGIVTVAGGFYFPVFLVSLRMLRKTGSTLPIEVFLTTHREYEPEICEQVLPLLNAKCIVLDDIFNHEDGAYRPTATLSGFQYKVFAMLFSSFDEFLFLDADDIALRDPISLFDSEPFATTGMVTWPDLWSSSTSPIYYLIANQQPPLVSARPTMESGQILVSKEKHFHTLLLASYYNYYGPSHYYTLLCQTTSGRGDKDTFHPAAQALSLPFYAVSETPAGVGHLKAWPEGGHGEIYIYAMIQYDPIEDYSLTSAGKYRVIDPKVARPPRPFFLHANTPKWNPLRVFDHPGPYDLTWDITKHQSAAYTYPLEVVKRIEGVEQNIWDEVKWTACELEHKFKAWKRHSDICGKVTRHFENVLKPQLEKEKGKSEMRHHRSGLKASEP